LSGRVIEQPQPGRCLLLPNAEVLLVAEAEGCHELPTAHLAVEQVHEFATSGAGFVSAAGRGLRFVIVQRPLHECAVGPSQPERAHALEVARREGLGSTTTSGELRVNCDP
jgi:hypothetical protein